MVVALVKKFGEKKGLFVANLGDSRALLLRGGNFTSILTIVFVIDLFQIRQSD